VHRSLAAKASDIYPATCTFRSRNPSLVRCVLVEDAYY
jgi:hypothetical protein